MKTASEIIAKILSAKGQFVSVRFKSEVATSAQYKGVLIEKVTKAVVRAGINFANLTSVKEGIENGERGEVQPLPWGQWKQFPYIIEHKGFEYIRLYPSPNNVPHVEYFVNGKQVQKSEIYQYLTPSKVAEIQSPKAVECFTIKKVNVLDITE